MLDKLQDYNGSFSLANDIAINRDNKKLIYVIENWEYVHEAIKPIFNDLIESFGFYPYLKRTDNLSMAAIIRNEYHKSNNLKTQNNNNITFHFEQKYLEEKIANKQNLLISAPTSFGKSLLIEEFVARKQYNNILIIQPTLALIDETRQKLKKYSDFYNIIVNTKQNISDKNIFILTSERVLELYPSIQTIDLFIVDEFYKISNKKKDDRVSQLNIAFYKIMSKTPQLLLLTPKIDRISKNFIKKYNLEFFKTDYTLVNQSIDRISFPKNKKKEELFKLLTELNEPTIVYCKSPRQAEDLAKEYIDSLTQTNERQFPIFEWIDNNISPNWILKTLLKNGIGIHNGLYPRHVVNSQLDYFNKGSLRIIFATTSLIEGVNTVAKNIIIYEMKKGNNKISYFDYNNIKGRAGRMMKYYTGNIYYFDTPPKQEIEEIDIPIIEQDEELQSEILINLEVNDINKERKKDYDSITRDIPYDLLEIFKLNYYDVKKQKKLYYFLISNKHTLDILLWDTHIPNYDVLKKTFEVINHHLDERTGNSHLYLTKKCVDTVRNNMKQLIIKEIEYQNSIDKKNKKSNEEIENISISNVLSFIKKHAQYSIPKKLSILESIVNYISKEQQADYSSFIVLLEYEGVNEKLSTLLDFGVPASALRKIKKIPEENIFSYIKENINNFGFDKYEMDIIRKVI